MLTSAALRKLIAGGSKEDVEILLARAATAERMARALAALANTRGGVLIVPFDFKETSDPSAMRDRALQALLMIEPRLIVPLPYLVGEEGGPPEALVVEVPEGLPHVYAVMGATLGERADAARSSARAPCAS